MKRIISITLVIMLMVVSLAGCTSAKDKDVVPPNDEVGTTDEVETDDEVATDLEGKITLITDKGNIDDKSFNQGSWEGVVEFAEREGMEHTYIKPEEASDAGYLSAIDLAIQGGATVVVTPGFLFEVAVYEAQTNYPDVKFILLDGSPHTADFEDFDTKENVASIMYAEEESGYLAGYAAVMDGKTNLGFMGGMSVPAVQAFGYGYLQGAEAAAEELELEDGAIKSIYHYTGNFDETDTNKATAKTMYQQGMEVIFACGGSVGKSVMSAASESDALVIGVDVDQRYDSETVMTSAAKGLAASVVSVLDSIFKTDDWATYSGKTTFFNAANNGVSLPTEVIGEDNADAFDRFESFNKADYEELFSKLESGSITPIREIDVADPSGNATAEELTSSLNLKKVTVTTR